MSPLFQYWMQSDVDREVAPLIEGWRGYAGALHRLFDDAAAERLICENFSSREVSAYRLCRVPAMRADYFRLCALEAFGGMYVDADVRIKRAGLERIAKGKGLLFIRNNNVANDLMIANFPGADILRYARRTATQNIEARLKGGVWSVTGPGILTKLYREDETLFDGWTIVSLERMRDFVQFVSKKELRYKSGEDHWVGRKEIYTDTAAEHVSSTTNSLSADQPCHESQLSGPARPEVTTALPQGAVSSPLQQERVAIVHVGFHKTATTSLQFLLRDVFSSAGGPQNAWFSSQHAPGHEWRGVRQRHWNRSKSWVAHQAAQTPVAEQSGDRLPAIPNMQKHRAALVEYFARDEDFLIHSDENTLGFPLFHNIAPGSPDFMPFYPGAERLLEEFVSVVHEAGYDVELVFTIRELTQLVSSSLKMAIDEGRLTPESGPIAGVCQSIAPRLKSILEHGSALDQVAKIRVVDSGLAKQDFQSFASAIVGERQDLLGESDVSAATWRANVSPNARAAKLRSMFASDDVNAETSMPQSIHDSLRADGENLYGWLERFAQDSPKVQLYWSA